MSDRNADDVRDELRKAWDNYFAIRIPDATAELTDDQLQDLLHRFTDWERTVAVTHPEYDNLAALLCWPIVTELGRRQSDATDLENHLLHDGHHVYVDHDDVNTERPFLAVCSCEDDRDWCGPYPSLTQAMEGIADHLEANGIDRYREDYKIVSEVLTNDEIAEAWETFVAADRIARGGGESQP